jgi:hypothetical protein
MPRNTTATAATTVVQQARIEALQDESGWPRLYTYPVNGETIIGQFRRYITREDATCIDRALYDFLMMVCGFIAEYGLIPPDGGFRIVWAEPAALIEELARGAAATRTGRVQRVYRDGMTDVEVLAAIDELAGEHQATCRAGRAQRALNHDISAAVKLLEPHGFTIVPPGWRLSERDEPATAGQQPPGSLADALMRLAQANGLMLAAPPAVDATGQIRLL